MTDAPKPAKAPEADAKTYRMRPTLRVVLFLSLAMNLVVVGLVAGFIVRGGPPHPPKRGGSDYVIPYTRAFDEDQRKDVWRSLKRDFAERRERGGDRAGVIAGYNQALEVLRAEPFDQAAMIAVLEGQTARANERLAAGQQVLTNHLSALTQAERAAYADRLAREIERLEERRSRWGSDKR